MYLRITGRTLLNVHSANAEGAIGAFVSLSKMWVVKRKEGKLEVSEEPVISGNMLKHWHAVALTDLLSASGSNSICDFCKRYVMFRSVHNLRTEFEYIKKCAIEDVHGFLDPKSNIRRESLVKFSFLIPVEEGEARVSAITHNRVVLTPEGKVPTEEEAEKLYGIREAMMAFKREHASGFYGFLCSMDLGYVGRALQSPELCLDLEERRNRAKLAILALMHVISGQMGAAQARALVATKATELLCVVSNKPIPNVTHGFYKDYIENSAHSISAMLKVGVLKKDNVRVITAGDRVKDVLISAGVPSDIIRDVKSAEEAIGEAATLVDEWVA